MNGHGAFRIPHSAFWMLSSRYLSRRRLRTLLVVASIALGVATLVATRALSDSLGKAAEGAITPWSAATDLIVLNGQAGVPAAAVETIKAAALPAVREAQPVVVGRVGLPDLDNRPVLLLGVDPSMANRQGDNPWGVTVQWHDPAAGFLAAALTGRKPALIGHGLADELARALPNGGRDFRVLAAGRERRVRAVGTVRLEGPAAPLGGSALFLRAADAAELVYPTGADRVTQVNIALVPGADREAVRRRLQELVGDAAEVRTAEANDRAVRDVTAGLELGFAIGGAGALIVGLFLVYNALAVSVAERRHDIGVLRALGATRGQVAGLFVAEAAALGVVGAAGGVPLGLALGRLGVGPMGRLLSEMFTDLSAAPATASAWTLALAAAAGVATALLAALVPALQAAREEPADAVRRVPAGPGWLGRLAQLAAVALLAAGGAACVVWRDRLPTRAGAFGGIVGILLAAMAATPLATALLARLLHPLARGAFGLEGRLAADNLVRSPGRTGLVIGALAATTALVVQTAGFVGSTKAALFDWLDGQVAADLFVTAGGAASSSGLTLSMDESVGQRLQAMPEVAAALPVRFHRLDFRDRIVVLVAVDAAAFAGTRGDFALARNMARFPRLREPGTVIVSDNFARLYGVSVGDRLTVRGRRGPVAVEVIGTAADYTWNRGTLIVDRAWFKETFADDLVDVYDVFLHPGSDPEAVRATVLDRWGRSEALFVLTRPELRRDVAAVLDRVYGVAYAQQAVVGVVAVLGVVGALLISVLQRRRELGLLRAVGATRGQVLRSVLAEAVLMGVIGAAVGVAAGALLEWYTLDLLLPDESGFVFPLRFPWAAAGLVVGLGVLLATLAGLGPALHATRQGIAAAIAYE